MKCIGQSSREFTHKLGGVVKKLKSAKSPKSDGNDNDNISSVTVSCDSLVPCFDCDIDEKSHVQTNAEETCQDDASRCTYFSIRIHTHISSINSTFIKCTNIVALYL